MIQYLAAKWNNIFALERFRDCYYHGYCVKKDLKKAVKLYEKAAEKGLKEAKIKFDVFFYKDGNHQGTVTDETGKNSCRNP